MRASKLQALLIAINNQDPKEGPYLGNFSVDNLREAVRRGLVIWRDNDVPRNERWRLTPEGIAALVVPAGGAS